MSPNPEEQTPDFPSPALAWSIPIEVPLEKDYDLGRGDALKYDDNGQAYLIRLTERGMEELGGEDTSVEKMWKAAEEEGLL